MTQSSEMSLVEQTETGDTIKARIREHLQEEFLYNSPAVKLTDASPLIEEGIVDSMGIFRLISFLEEAFDVHLNPEEIMLENFETVNAIATFVTEKSSV